MAGKHHQRIDAGSAAASGVLRSGVSPAQDIITGADRVVYSRGFDGARPVLGIGAMLARPGCRQTLHRIIE